MAVIEDVYAYHKLRNTVVVVRIPSVTVPYKS